MWWGFWFRADTVQKQQYIDVIVVLTQPRKVWLTSDLSTLSVQLLGSINTKSDQNQWQGFRYSTVFSLKQQFVVIIVNHDFRSFHTDLGSLWLYPIIVQKFEINRTIFHFSIICSLETFTNQRDRTFLARPICGRNTRENFYTCIQNVNIHTVKSVKSIRNILWNLKCWHNLPFDAVVYLLEELWSHFCDPMWSHLRFAFSTILTYTMALYINSKAYTPI